MRRSPAFRERVYGRGRRGDAFRGVGLPAYPLADHIQPCIGGAATMRQLAGFGTGEDTIGFLY